MNIMDYLLDKGLGLTENQANEMELEIREGIAREIEQLVLPSAAVNFHGIPSSAEVSPNPVIVQQDMFRGAANVVRGKNPATEEDWHNQSEAMRKRAHDQMQERLGRMFQLPDEAAQLQAEKRAERLREWNDKG